MKELSIEEKAKRYDEALKVLHKYDGANIMFTQDLKEEIFPELKESEDEKIRKALIKFLTVCDEADERELQPYQKWIAWLEKQGEIFPVLSNSNIGKDKQKIADKVGSKFKIGDLITNGILVGKIDEIHELGYHAYFGDHYADVPDAENWHKWTIQDAKAGDVLSFNDGHGNDSIELIKSITGKKIEFWFCLTNGNRYEVFDGIIPYTNFASREDATLATKEQRELLFQKMKEAGYEFDFEKKELKKIYQKSDWGEEDEMIALSIEQIMNCASLFNIVPDKIEKVKSWLKNLKDRVQLKQEWSEEDKRELDSIYQIIDFLPISDSHLTKENKKAMLNWLKFLKPQSQWKPSEEQMITLRQVISGCSYDVEPLVEIEEQLKKLREE